MIIKSFIIASIFFNMIGLNTVSQKFDEAVIRDMAGAEKVAVASNIIEIPLPEIMPRPIVKMNAPKSVANARHYILIDSDTGSILSKNDPYSEVPIASTTKIMTAVVALENYNLDEIATISSTAANQIGAEAYLRPGEQITIKSLLNCMLIPSGNDAAFALAEHMGNDTKEGIAIFLQKMNEKAAELDMNNTKYNDPAGLDVSGYSSANDLAIITKYALKFPLFREIVQKDNEVEKSADGSIWHALKQSNRLVAEYKYPGAIGVKTGFMPEAGHCLVGAAERNGHTLIAVVLNTYADTPSASADEAKRLLDWGFSYIEWK